MRIASRQQFNSSLTRFVAMAAATFFLAAALPGAKAGVEPRAEPPGKADLAQLPPGPVLITCPAVPAECSITGASTRLETAAEGAGETARAVLNTPHFGHPRLEAAIGALQCIAAPFAAAYGALDASHARMAPGQLKEAETDLSRAMSDAASQARLCRLVFNAVQRVTHRSVSCRLPGSTTKHSKDTAASAILQTTIRHLALAHVRGPRSDFALTIEAQARLLAAPSGAVLMQRTYRYQSGPAMFVDWTRYDGLASVAETGYRELADKVAADFFQPKLDAPLLLGVGQKAPSALKTANLHPPAHAGAPDVHVQPVNYLQADLGSLQVQVGPTDQGLLVRGMASQPDSGSDSPSDAEWALHGLQDDPNPVVQGVSCVASVPVGIWEQTVGLVRKHSREKAERAALRLEAIASQMQLEQVVADQVADNLRSGSGSSVVEQVDFAPSRAAAVQPAMALEIRVLSTELKGKHHFSRARSLCVRMQATLYRISDGQELYAVPLQYESSQRKLTQWAASNGELFRQEFERCCQETSQAVTRQLVALGFVTPGRFASPVAANP